MNMNNVSAELPIELVQSLKTSKVKKHEYSMIWLHWFNAAVWALLLSTGGALISLEKIRFAPITFQRIVISIFGSKVMVLKFHIWVGVIWIIVYCLYFLGTKRYWPIIKSVLMVDADDSKWVMSKGLSILGKKVQMPHQGFFNGGQKLFAITVYLYIPIIAITGLIMSFQLFSPAVIRWSIIFHFLSVAIILFGLPVHIFMAGFYAPEREDLVSMFTGHVSEWFAFKHNFKWWIKQDTKNARQIISLYSEPNVVEQPEADPAESADNEAIQESLTFTSDMQDSTGPGPSVRSEDDLQ